MLDYWIDIYRYIPIFTDLPMIYTDIYRWINVGVQKIIGDELGIGVGFDASV